MARQTPDNNSFISTAANQRVSEFSTTNQSAAATFATKRGNSRPTNRATFLQSLRGRQPANFRCQPQRAGSQDPRAGPENPPPSLSLRRQGGQRLRRGSARKNRREKAKRAPTRYVTSATVLLVTLHMLLCDMRLLPLSTITIKPSD